MGEVDLQYPMYIHVPTVSGLSDRNGECTIQTNDGVFDRVNPESLLWIGHFSSYVPIDLKVK